jgi:hypothetical protein
MKRILHFLLLLLTISFFGCAWNNEKAFADSKKEFEGWGGAPEDPYKKPFDFFYMRAKGRASTKAMMRRSGAMMQTTCTDTAVTGMKGNMIGKLISEVIQGASGNTDRESSGVLIVREFKGELQGVNVKECRPLYAHEPTTPYSGWKECECIVYWKFPGGKNAIIAAMEKNRK